METTGTTCTIQLVVTHFKALLNTSYNVACIMYLGMSNL